MPISRVMTDLTSMDPLYQTNAILHIYVKSFEHIYVKTFDLQVNKRVENWNRFY